MTVKEASEKFNIDEKEIRKRNKDGMILGVRKDGRHIVIPNDTIIIPAKKEIQSLLLQIIKLKNCDAYPINRKVCLNEAMLKAIITYLYERGFIEEIKFESDIKDLFHKIRITDDGFDYVIGYGTYGRLSRFELTPISINPSVNFTALRV